MKHATFFALITGFTATFTLHATETTAPPKAEKVQPYTLKGEKAEAFISDFSSVLAKYGFKGGPTGFSLQSEADEISRQMINCYIVLTQCGTVTTPKTCKEIRCR